MSAAVCIVNYGMGNLLSVFHALEIVGAEVKICSRPEEILDAERIVLPGVGAFRDCMRNLREGGFVEVLNRLVLHDRRPIIGICLGMQAMARQSFEGGQFQGLGWFEADVVRIEPSDSSLRVPQIGWNDIKYVDTYSLFSGLPLNPDFYFVHSYHMKCHNKADVQATCDYGGTITAAVMKDNIFATQFHPEKSQDFGLKILDNFLKWTP